MKTTLFGLLLVLCVMITAVACTAQDVTPQATTPNTSEQSSVVSDTQASPETAIQETATATTTADDTQADETIAEDVTAATTQAPEAPTDTSADTSAPTLTKENVAYALGGASQSCKAYISKTNTLAVPAVKNLSAIDSIQWEPSDRAEIVMACVWYLDFLKNICEYNDFTPTDTYEVGQFIDHLSGNGDTQYVIRYMFAYDAEAGAIESVCWVKEQPYSDYYYFEFDISYDTQTNAVGDFTMMAYLGDPDDAYYFSYMGDTLYVLKTTATDYTQTISYMVERANLHRDADWLYHPDATDRQDLTDEYNDANPYVSPNN